MEACPRMGLSELPPTPPHPDPAPSLLPLSGAASREHPTWPWRASCGNCSFSPCYCCFVVRRHLVWGHSIPSGPWDARGLSSSRVEPRLRLPFFFFFLTRVWKGRTLTAALPAGFAEGPHDSSTVRGAEGKGLGLQGMHKVLCGAVMSW